MLIINTICSLITAISCATATTAAAPQQLGRESKPVTALAVAHGGAVLAIAGGTPFRYTPSEGGLVSRSTFNYVTGQNAVAFNMQGQFAATAGADGKVRVWEIKTGNLIKILAGHRAPVTALAFMPGAEMLASGSQDGSIIIWRNIYYVREGLKNGAEESGPDVAFASFKGAFPVKALAFSADETAMLAASYRNGEVAVWRRLQGQPTLFKTRGAADTLAFSPDGKFLAEGTVTGIVALRDTATGKETASSQPLGGRITALAFLPGNTGLFAAPENGDITLLSAACKTLMTTPFTGGGLLSFALSPDGARMAAGGKDGTLLAWNAATLTTSVEPARPQMPVLSTKALPAEQNSDGKARGFGGKWILLAAAALTVFLLRKKIFIKMAPPVLADFAAPQEAQWQFPETDKSECGRLAASLVVPHRAPVTAMQCSPLGEYIVSAGPDGRTALYAGPEGKIVRTMDSIDDTRPSLTFSEDGKSLAIATSGEEHSFIQVLPIPYGVALNKWKGPRAEMLSAAFMPDGRQLLLAMDKTLYKWDMKPLHKPETALSFEETAAAIRIFPSGKGMACLHKNGSITIWVLRKGWLKTATLAEQGSNALSLALSPDGKTLAAGLMDGNISFWKAPLWNVETKIAAHKTPVSSLQYSHCGRVLAAGVEDGSIVLLRMEDSSQITTIQAATGRLAGLSFMADGTMLASAGGGNCVKLWDTAPCCAIKSRTAKKEEVVVDTLPQSPAMPAKPETSISIKEPDKAIAEEKALNEQPLPAAPPPPPPPQTPKKIVLAANAMKLTPPNQDN